MPSSTTSPPSSSKSRIEVLQEQIAELEASLRPGSPEEIAAALHVLQGLGLKMEDPGQSLDVHLMVSIRALQTVSLKSVTSATKAISLGQTDVLVFWPSVPKLVTICQRFEGSDQRLLDNKRRELAQRLGLPPPPRSEAEDERLAAKVAVAVASIDGGELRKPHWLEKLPDLPGAETLPNASDQMRR